MFNRFLIFIFCFIMFSVDNISFAYTEDIVVGEYVIIPVSEFAPKTTESSPEKVYEKPTKKVKEQNIIKKLRKPLYEYIMANSKNKDPKYVSRVTEAYLRLIKEKTTNKHIVLYMVAIGCVESNFSMNSTSSAGAIGISQIMYNVHKDKLLAEGITEKKARKDPYYNIKAGLIIFESYWRCSDYNYTKACFKYLSSESQNYINKVNRNFANLQLKVMSVLLL